MFVHVSLSTMIKYEKWVPYSKTTLAVKKCDEIPLLKKLAEKTWAIETIFADVFTTKVFTVWYVRLTTRCQLIS